MDVVSGVNVIIEIDPNQHKSDGHIRSTLLHEMAHVATPGSGHGWKFFAQMERLLQKGALPSIEVGDVGEVRVLNEVVPKRFPLLRARVQLLEKRRVDALYGYAAAKGQVFETITDDQIIRDFGEVAACSWKPALLIMGYEYGLTDEAGRPKSAWARRIVAKGRKVHQTARRDHLEYQRAVDAWKTDKRVHGVES